MDLSVLASAEVSADSRDEGVLVEEVEGVEVETVAEAEEVEEVLGSCVGNAGVSKKELSSANLACYSETEMEKRIRAKRTSILSRSAVSTAIPSWSCCSHSVMSTTFRFWHVK